MCATRTNPLPRGQNCVTTKMVEEEMSDWNRVEKTVERDCPVTQREVKCHEGFSGRGPDDIPPKAICPVCHGDVNKPREMCATGTNPLPSLEDLENEFAGAKNRARELWERARGTKAGSQAWQAADRAKDEAHMIRQRIIELKEAV